MGWNKILPLLLAAALLGGCAFGFQEKLPDFVQNIPGLQNGETRTQSVPTEETSSGSDQMVGLKYEVVRDDRSLTDTDGATLIETGIVMEE